MNWSDANTMLKRKQLLEFIGIKLAHLKACVATLNAIHFFDLNVVAEDFFVSLLNEVYGYSLVNLNHTELNKAAIDLGDSSHRLAVQVTSERTTAKIQKTLNKFVEHGLDKEYDALKILIIGDRTGDYTTLNVPTGIKFVGKSDVIDIGQLIKDISNLDLSHIERIANLIQNEVHDYPETASEQANVTGSWPRGLYMVFVVLIVVLCGLWLTGTLASWFGTDPPITVAYEVDPDPTPYFPSRDTVASLTDQLVAPELVRLRIVNTGQETLRVAMYAWEPDGDRRSEPSEDKSGLRREWTKITCAPIKTEQYDRFQGGSGWFIVFVRDRNGVAWHVLTENLFRNARPLLTIRQLSDDTSKPYSAHLTQWSESTKGA